MLAFYAWTDLLLINHINVKNAFYPDDKADLFVLMLPRVTANLVETIRNSLVFTNVYEIQLHQWFEKMSVFQKICSLFRRNYYYKFYCKQLEQSVGHRLYKSFFIGAFWAESLHLIRYFLSVNSDLEINFVEEGTVSYQEVSGLLKCMPRKGIREIFLRYFHFYPWNRLARRQSKALFVYQPSLIVNKKWLDIIQIPSITQDNPIPQKALYYPIMNELLESLANDIDIKSYVNAQIFYCVSPPIGQYNVDYEENKSIFNKIINEFPSVQILIRPHPDCIANELEYFQKFDDKIYVETSTLPMEVVFHNIDIESKILIARNSSILIIPKLMFEKEPYIIMTHRLYSGYEKYDDSLSETYLKQIYSLYGNKDRVFAPKNEEELIVVIQTILHNKQQLR